MMEFEKSLHIEDETFSEAREALNRSIQDTIHNMVVKDAGSGTATLKIGFEIIKEEEPGRDPIRRLKITHKVDGKITLSRETVKGETMSSEDELEHVNDEWCLMPITGRAQRTVLDQ